MRRGLSTWYNFTASASVKVLLPGKKEIVAFTLIELLIVLSLVAILVALLMPAGLRMIEAGRAASCTAKLRNLTQMFRQYRDDNNQLMYTNTSSWVSPFAGDGLIKYPKETECPSASASDSWLTHLSGWDAQTLSSYSINASAFYKSSFSSYFYFVGYEATTPIFMDGKVYGLNPASWDATNRLNAISLRHNNRANVAFMDGHIETLDQAGVLALQPLPPKH